jgi:co-chaperonin GroES (HSP10)
MDIECLEPLAPYFLIKIGKKEQTYNREHLTQHIIADTSNIAMTRELQFGEIISIGSGASQYMPMAEIGDFALVHHFISGKADDKGYRYYFLMEDENYNYYAVNAYEIAGEKPLLYAIAKGSEIIPTPDYIFLEVEKEGDKTMLVDQPVSENGFIVPKEKKKTRADWTAIMQQNVGRIKQLSRNLPTSTMDEIMIRENPERREKYEFALTEIKRLEAINYQISKDINKKKYEPFVVAALNPDWQSYMKEVMGEEINPGDIIYFLNIAAHTKMNFGGTEYIVAETKYFGISETHVKKSISDFERNNITTEKTASRSRNKKVVH